MNIAASVAGVAAIAAVALFVLRRLRGPEAPQGVVLLLANPKAIDAEHLAALFSAATLRPFQTITQPAGHRIGSDDIPEGDVVLAEPPSFIVQSGETLFLVNAVAKPYFSDPDKLSRSLKKLQTAIAAHQAWLSVEILHPEAVTPANCRIVGQVVAGLLDAECTALFHPGSNTAIPNSGSQTAELLRGTDPLTNAFGADPLQA